MTMRAFALGVIAACFWVAGASAQAVADPEVVLSCPIEGQDRVATVSVSGNQAIYQYGRPQEAPELRLMNSLAALDYRREDGAGDTIDEHVTFANGDTRYELAAGFRQALDPDPTALRPFGTLSVSQGDKQLAHFTCRTNGMERRPDRLLARMRDIGRETASDGLSFPNYPIHPAMPAAQSPPCEADSNVDTCWSRGVSAARYGDLKSALEHYDMSCAARIGTMGCYEAGKLYLHNRQLRDYQRARQRLARTCDGDDAGQGPYACKYLGWMYLTGTGVQRDLHEAFGTLAQACFLHNDQILIDPEGCHFLGEAVLAGRDRSSRDRGTAEYLAYISFAQGCTDAAETVCDEARAVYRRAKAQGADWIARCDRDVADHGEIASCSDLALPRTDYDAAQSARRQFGSLFRQVSTAMD